MAALVNLFATSGIFLLILVGAYARFRYNTRQVRRLLPVLLVAIILLILHLITANLTLSGILGSSGLIWAGNALFIAALGLNPLSEAHSKQRLIQLWLIFCLGWVIVLVATIGDTHPISGGTLTTNQIAALTGLIITGAYLSFVHLYTIAQANNAELTNRTLFWLIITFLCYGGCLLSASATPFLILPGLLMIVSSVIMTVYTTIEKRILDLRIGIIFGLRALILALVASVAIFIALYIGQEIRLSNTQATIAILGLIALVTALFYTPIEQVLSAVTNALIARFRPNLVAILREYSQIISQATTLEEVAEQGTTHLSRLLRVQSAALILINDTGRRPDAVELLIMKPPEGNTRAFLPKFGAIYEALAVQQRPLLQSDLELDADTPLDAEEEALVAQLNMRAYAPITLEKSLIGIMACGPKRDGSIFNSDDLNILYALAQQVGIALRNARLIDDLQHLNTSMRSLNQGLAQAKQELEKLDSVKTDFITIASHELRTPLAQIRGYTDILESLNEQGLLDPDQTREMTANLRKATERIEELISAMLDVSQLDVNAMDLHFIETSPETIVKLAIEPLTDAIFRRRIAFTARGLRGLPTFYGDLQRLVQAFRNVIVNAIKFTPDEGQIDVSAALIPRDEPNSDVIRFEIRDSGVGIAPEHIEFIFDKFYRGYDPSLHSTGTYKFMGAGPGLGLTIARGIIEGHGGKIWAESPGHNMQTFPGSVFYIELPLTPPKGSGLVLGTEEDKKRATREMKIAAAEANA